MEIKTAPQSYSLHIFQPSKLSTLLRNCLSPKALTDASLGVGKGVSIKTSTSGTIFAIHGGVESVRIRNSDVILYICPAACTKPSSTTLIVRIICQVPMAVI